MHVTVRLHTVLAFLAGVALTVAAAFVFSPWRAGAAPGDDDATLVPISSCRLIDTREEFRIGAGAALGQGETRVLTAHGSNGECAIPSDATGLVMNVTALGATLPTFLAIWPDGGRPTASSLNPTPGAPPVPNAVTTKLATDGSFRLFNLQGNVEVIIDVTGYFTDTSLDEIVERLDALDAADEQLRRAVGYGFATIEDDERFNGGTAVSPSSIPVGLVMRFRVCTDINNDCIVMEAPQTTETIVHRFDATNTPRWATVVERLTNGEPNVISLSGRPVNSSGIDIDLGFGTGGNDTEPFPGLMRSSLHPAFADFEDADIGSIAVRMEVIEFDVNPTVIPTTYSYRYRMSLTFEMPGAPPLPD